MEPRFVCTETYPIAQTQQGKLKGFEWDGVLTFYGIKYADAQRFQAPTSPKSWEGVKNAWSYGAIAPTYGTPRPHGGTADPPPLLARQ